MHGKRDRAGRYRQAIRPELVPLDDALDWADARPGPAAQVEQADLWRHVDATLDCRARVVVRLTYQWDLTQQEIAAVIGCSQMHVSRILRAALAQLRDAASTVAPWQREGAHAR